MKLSSDKIGHFIIGFVFYVLTAIIYKPVSSWIVITIALLKEFCDRAGKGYVELEDILATVLGGFIAFLFIG